MRIVIGQYLYFTKHHFLRIKNYFPHTYIRDDFDTIIIDSKHGKITITQDGLIYLTSEIKKTQYKTISKWFKEKIIKKILDLLDQHNLLTKLITRKNEIIILHDQKNINDAYERHDRKKDYEFKTKNITKHYGNGMIIFNNNKFPEKVQKDLIEYQLIFADYQETISTLLNYCKKINTEINELKRKETIKFHEIPKIMDQLLVIRKETKIILKKISQLDDFLEHRKSKCKIKKILDELKLNDFHEMIQMNTYTYDQYELTYYNIKAIIELTEFYYKENEQKELTILQVIFALGTIAAIVSLGAMPGAKVFANMSNGVITGEISSFTFPALMEWGIISLISGIILFWILNYIFYNLKKIRTVNLFKHNIKRK